MRLGPPFSKKPVAYPLSLTSPARDAPSTEKNTVGKPPKRSLWFATNDSASSPETTTASQLMPEEALSRMNS